MSDKTIKINQPDMNVVSVYAAPPFEEGVIPSDYGSTGTMTLSGGQRNRVRITRTVTIHGARVTTEVVLETAELTFQQLKEEAIDIIDRYEQEDEGL